MTSQHAEEAKVPRTAGRALRQPVQQAPGLAVEPVIGGSPLCRVRAQACSSWAVWPDGDAAVRGNVGVVRTLRSRKSGAVTRWSSWTAGPGAFFARHPVAHRISLAGAAGAAVTFAAKAMRSVGHRRLGWAALSLLEAGQLAGIWWTRHRAILQSLPSANAKESGRG